MKKKIITLLLCTVLILTVLNASGFASPYGFFRSFPVARVLVDNRHINADDVPAIIMEGRTLVPLRLVAEAMDGEVEWDQNTYTVFIKTSDEPRTLEITAEEGWQALASAEDAFRINEFYRRWNDFSKTLSSTWIAVINLNTNTFFVEQTHYETFKNYNAENMFASAENQLKELEEMRENILNEYTDNVPTWEGNTEQIKSNHALYSYLSMSIINNLWESFSLTHKAFAEYEADYRLYTILHEDARSMAQELENSVLTLQRDTGANKLSWELILNSIFTQNPLN